MSNVLVIGAGPAGLCSGYFLARAGIDYEIVDRADHIGSTWANLYPSLKLNTAGFVSNMPGQAMPLRYGLLPLGWQYYEHLSTWSQQHPLNVRLSVEVCRISPSNGGWRAQMSVGTHWYRAVILASGRFCNAYIPSIPGLDTFQGECLHARDFHDPAPYMGKRVLIVGSGPSGADIATAIIDHHPRQLLFAIRSDMVIARRNPFGINETIWKAIQRALPVNARGQKWLSDRINFQSYRGIRKLGLPLAPNRDDRKGTSVPVRGPELVHAIRDGRIQPVRGLRRLDGQNAVLDDGSAHEVDVVIFATGYRPALQYLDIEFQSDDHGWPLRDIDGDSQSTAILGHPGLFLVGRDYRGLGALYNIKQEAKKAAGQVASYLSFRQVPPPPKAK